ncbi:MAG: TetR/AcrR family transcriptional regulator [Cellvibrionaceae bacterium]|nr:TetR/AcrR family transcriptional regulator [Cellvibrionaceae bacterium]
MPPAPKHSPQEQEDMILCAAAKCVQQTSLLDFTMSAIAKEAGVSIGTLYKHVQSKEDVLVALGTRMSRHLHDTFAQTLSLDLSTPEKIIALGLLDPHKTQCYDFDSHLDALVNCEAILRRASPRWLENMSQSIEACGALFEKLWQNAIDNGELDIEASNTTIAELSTATWSMHVGYSQVVLRQHNRSAIQLAEPLPYPLPADDLLIKNFTRLLNSYDWQQKVDDAGVQRALAAVSAAGLR